MIDTRFIQLNVLKIWSPQAGFEPATFRPPVECATKLRHAPCVNAALYRERRLTESRWRAGPPGLLKRVTGVEPALGAWKAPVQPIHLTRIKKWGPDYRKPALKKPGRIWPTQTGLLGFEPRRTVLETVMLAVDIIAPGGVHPSDAAPVGLRRSRLSVRR